MNDQVIRVQELGKEYQIGLQERGYTTFREAIANAASAPLRRFRSLSGRGDAEAKFWALKNVSFDIHRGEIVGVIGRNGAGKSTLLKILSQITEPTTGEVRMAGRVGSLLEVGTGFHPELTGRENIYLNGAILGMSRREVARKFDEIVAFSEVERFLDTPVKRYSSGMHTRLAFSVAAHLEPEIMIIDEVLAVGDSSFQQKCLGKMENVARSGRTVLFVSHNMAAIEGLCGRCVVLEGGELAFDGATNSAIQSYYSKTSNGPNPTYKVATDYKTLTTAHVRSARAECSDGSIAQVISTGSSLTFCVECESTEPIHDVSLGIGVENKRGVRIFTLHTKCAAGGVPSTLYGRRRYTCQLGNVSLVPGVYTVKIALASGDTTLDFVERAFCFTIQAGDYFNNAGKLVGGVVFVPQEWTSSSAPESHLCL